MKRYRFTVLLFLVLTACNFNVNASYENEENEKENAESKVALFYNNTEKNDITNVMNLFSDSFYKISDRNKFKTFLIEKKKTLGDFKSYVLEDWKTTRVEGTSPKTEYLLIYKVEYSKFSAVETFSLIKEKGEVKILGYHVDSKGFGNVSD
jgi:hypothetical protein